MQSEGREDLTRALQVLAAQPEAGARLYAATLRVVLLKSVVNEGLLNWQVVRSQKICSDMVQPYFEWALQLVDHLIVITEDLISAFPEKKSASKNSFGDHSDIRFRMRTSSDVFSSYS